MVTLRNVALFVLTVSFFTFVAFFGRLPALRNTPIGFLHRIIWIHIPKSFHRLDIAVTGGRLSRSVARTINYLMNERHPIVLIFFLGLLTISAGMFVPSVWTELPPIHYILIPTLLPLPYLFTYICATTKIHHITPYNNADQLRHYPFDHMLFHPGQICRTCNLEKPARSKHCSICKTCVARNDHHCIWVNACLGRGNYKYFLYLLLSTTVVLAYGAYLSYLYLSPRVKSQLARYPSAYAIQIPDWAANLPWPFSYFVNLFFHIAEQLVAALQVGGISTTGVGLLSLLTTPLPFGLLAYHVYLIWAGTTTNETSKWADWRDDMADGTVFLGAIREDADITEAERSSPWPVRSHQILLRTSDGQSPRALPDIVKAVFDENVGWRRTWRLNDVENIYDLGWWDNLHEMIMN